MKRIKRIITGAAGLGLLTAVRPQAEATGRTYIDNTVLTGFGVNIGLVLAVAVLVLMFCAMIYFVKQGKSGRINVAWAVLGTVISGFAMLLCIVGSTSGTVYTRPDGDPAETVQLFYDSVKNRDYVAAYSCLGDHSTLGLEKLPQTENAKLAYEALRQSYDYSIMGKPQIDRLEATVRVRFQYLDMTSFEESVASRTNDNLTAFVKENPISAVYDENDQYLPEVTEKAYADALEFILNKADTYYSSTELSIKLEYVDGKWLIISDEAMLRPLMGGALY